MLSLIDTPGDFCLFLIHLEFNESIFYFINFFFRCIYLLERERAGEPMHALVWELAGGGAEGGNLQADSPPSMQPEPDPEIII